MADEAIITLTTKPHLQRRAAGQLVHVDKFEGWLDGELIVVSKQPRLDGARELLRRGYLPDALMTTRAEGRDYDSFIPAPIGEVAKWTIVEESRDGLRRRLWQPPHNTPVYPDTSLPVRKSPLRGVRLPETDDGAVAPDPSGMIARTDAA